MKHCAKWFTFSAFALVFTLSACARILQATDVIIVDGESYETRVYVTAGTDNFADITDTYVVINGREYNCASSRNAPPDCAETVRRVLERLRREAEEDSGSTGSTGSSEPSYNGPGAT